MTIEPAVSTNAGPLAPQSTTGIDVGEALVDTIAAEYVHRLRLAHSPLIATDELSFERADYARAVVHSVLTALSNPAGTAPTLDTRPVVVELADSGIGPSVALAGAALLFETALRRLDHALPHQNVDIAICLARHLLFGIARVLDSAGIAVQRQDLVTEIVDSSLLRATLSRREADIFMLLVDKAKTSDIAVAAQSRSKPERVKGAIDRLPPASPRYAARAALVASASARAGWRMCCRRERSGTAVRSVAAA